MTRHRRAGLALALTGALAACNDESTPPPGGGPPAKSESVARLERAIAKFKAPHEPPSKTDDPQLKLAMEAILRGDGGSAESILNEVLTANPDHPHALYFRGFLHQNQKLYAQARTDFERVLDAGPAFDKANGVFVYYAWCCYYLADLDAAKVGFQATIDLDVDPADGNYGLGLVSLDQGELDEALRRFATSQSLFDAKHGGKRALTRSNRLDLAKSRVRAGAALLKKADLEPERATEYLATARKNVEEATELIPWNDEAWFNLSRIYNRLGESELEKKALEKHAELKGSHSREPSDAEPGSGGANESGER